MKLIIDIDESLLDGIKSDNFDFARQVVKNFQGTIASAIANGAPISDNITNGDVLISLYPNLKYTIQNGRVVTTIGVASSFDLDWWNTPYKER